MITTNHITEPLAKSKLFLCVKRTNPKTNKATKTEKQPKPNKNPKQNKKKPTVLLGMLYWTPDHR